MLELPLQQRQVYELSLGFRSFTSLHFPDNVASDRAQSRQDNDLGPKRATELGIDRGVGIENGPEGVQVCNWLLLR